MSEVLLFVGVLALSSALVLAAFGAAMAVAGPRPLRRREDIPELVLVDESGPEPAPTRRTKLRVRCRVLFVHPHARSMTLDCVIDEPASEGEVTAGLPFSIAVAPPATSWFSDRVEELLAQWAAENRVVDLTVLELPTGSAPGVRPEVAIVSGESRLQLELRAAAGIEPALS